MDFIDYLIYSTNTANTRLGFTFPTILSDYIDPGGVLGVPGGNEIPIVPPVGLPVINASQTYAQAVRENYIFYQDTVVIDKAMQKHWFDQVNGPIGLLDTYGANVFGPATPPIYHLIFAYLVENSRIAQIMERLIYLYQHDEVLGVASSTNPVHQLAFQWIANTENLFYKTLSNTSYRNIAGNLRPNPEASRRNAYFRMFGMDLAFGEPTGSTGTDYSYFKAKSANKEFIILIEQFLAEIWQAYINAQNTSGANTTDYQRIIDMSTKLREMLMARRGGLGTISLANYRFMNLSKEEFSSVGFMTWLYYIISYDSPLVIFLGCQANTASERLTNIGRKVGIEAHSKAQALFDMSGPLATILRQIEFGTFEVLAPAPWVRRSIESQTPAGSLIATPEQAQALLDLLAVINNWEKATGHQIKNPESKISGMVKVQQNGVTRPQAKPVLN